MNNIKSFFTIKEAVEELTQLGKAWSEDDVIQAGVNGWIPIEASITKWLDSGGGLFIIISQESPSKKFVHEYSFPMAEVSRMGLLKFIPGRESAQIELFDKITRGPDGEWWDGIPTDDEDGTETIKLIIKRADLLVTAHALNQLISKLKKDSDLDFLPVGDGATELPSSQPGGLADQDQAIFIGKTGLMITLPCGDKLVIGQSDMAKELGHAGRESISNWIPHPVEKGGEIIDPYPEDSFPAIKLEGRFYACLSKIKAWGYRHHKIKTTGE